MVRCPKGICILFFPSFFHAGYEKRGVKEKEEEGAIFTALRRRRRRRHRESNRDQANCHNDLTGRRRKKTTKHSAGRDLHFFFCHLHIRVLLIPISLLRSHPVGPFFLTFVVASACSSPHRIESFSFSYLLFFAQRRDVTPAIISPFFFVSTSSFSTTTTTTTNLWEQFNLLLKPPLRFTWTSFVPSDFFSNFR